MFSTIVLVMNFYVYVSNIMQVESCVFELTYFYDENNHLSSSNFDTRQKYNEIVMTKSHIFKLVSLKNS